MLTLRTFASFTAPDIVHTAVGADNFTTLVAASVMVADVVNLKTAKTVHGSSVMTQAKVRNVMVDQAKVVRVGILSDNSVIHVIDSVILPKPDA